MTKIHLQPEQHWMAMLIFSQCQRTNLILVWLAGGKRSDLWKHGLFTANFGDTEFYWLSARCFYMWETSYLRRDKSNPEFLPSPSSQHTWRSLRSSLWEHYPPCPVFMLSKQVWSEKWLICVNEHCYPPK